MKKILALLLSVVLSLGMASVAYAGGIVWVGATDASEVEILNWEILGGDNFIAPTGITGEMDILIETKVTIGESTIDKGFSMESDNPDILEIAGADGTDITETPIDAEHYKQTYKIIVRYRAAEEGKEGKANVVITLDGKKALFPVTVTSGDVPPYFQGDTTFDRKAPGDISVRVYSSYEIESISNGGTALTEGTDYTFTSPENEHYSVLTIKESYLSAQPDGMLRLSVEFSVGPMELSIAIGDVSEPTDPEEPVDPEEPTDPSEPENPGDSGSSSGGSSSDDDDDSSSSISQVSSNVSPTTGAVKTSVILEDLDDAIAAADTGAASVQLKVRGAKTISADTLASLAQAASCEGVSARILADKVEGGRVVSRLYIDVQEAAALGQDINLEVMLNSRQIVSIFEHFFQNDIVVVRFGQQGTLGMEAEVAVKADLSKLDVSALSFYAYNIETNSYYAIAPKYHVDANGYLHFTTSVGSNIIITNGPLVSK